MSKQWFQIGVIWLLVAASAIAAEIWMPEQYRYLTFSAIAAASIALVSIEHLISSQTKDTVRQQVYVSAGTFLILGAVTLVGMLG